MVDISMSRGGMGNNRGPPESNRGYPDGNMRGSENNRGYSEGSRGYPDGNQDYGRQPAITAGQGFNNLAAQPGSPSAVDAKKAAYRYVLY